MKKLFISMIIMFIAIATVMGWWQYVTRARVDAVILDTSGYRGDSDGKNFFILSATGARENVPSEVAQHVMGPEWLTSMVMPIDTSIPHAIFLSTREIKSRTVDENGPCQSINRLYRYVIGSDALQELYTETSTSGSPVVPGKCRILRTVGRVGANPILLIDDPDNAPGPCTNIWADYADRFVLFDMTTKELRRFVVSPETIAAARFSEQQCLNHLP